MNKLYNQAILMALRVGFLADSEELFLYAGALYSAMKWGENIDEKNKRIQERGNPLK